MGLGLELVADNPPERTGSGIAEQDNQLSERQEAVAARRDPGITGLGFETEEQDTQHKDTAITPGRTDSEAVAWYS